MKKARSILGFSGLFILFTVIGTLSHELGHYTAALFLGHPATLHYGSTSYDLQIDSTSYPTQKCDTPPRLSPIARQALTITAAGPIQTLITGLLGLTLLYRRRSRCRPRFEWLDWLGVFMSLFWLRKIFNLSLSGYQLTQGFLTSDDEIKIAQILGLPELSISIPLGIIGLAIALYVVYKIVPPVRRNSFIIGGLLGGSLGFYLWFDLLGPVLLPWGVSPFALRLFCFLFCIKNSHKKETLLQEPLGIFTDSLGDTSALTFYVFS